MNSQGISIHVYHRSWIGKRKLVLMGTVAMSADLRHYRVSLVVKFHVLRLILQSDDNIKYSKQSLSSMGFEPVLPKYYVSQVLSPTMVGKTHTLIVSTRVNNHVEIIYSLMFSRLGIRITWTPTTCTVIASFNQLVTTSTVSC